MSHITRGNMFPESVTLFSACNTRLFQANFNSDQQVSNSPKNLINAPGDVVADDEMHDLQSTDQSQDNILPVI